MKGKTVIDDDAFAPEDFPPLGPLALPCALLLLLLLLLKEK